MGTEASAVWSMNDIMGLCSRIIDKYLEAFFIGFLFFQIFIVFRIIQECQLSTKIAMHVIVELFIQTRSIIDLFFIP